jgi:hypothetical protein
MTSWQERAYRLAERRVQPGHDALWVLLRAGLLGGQADGPYLAGTERTGVCPVCEGLTATTRAEPRPTPCTACRGRVIASMVTSPSHFRRSELDFLEWILVPTAVHVFLLLGGGGGGLPGLRSLAVILAGLAWVSPGSRTGGSGLASRGGSPG